MTTLIGGHPTVRTLLLVPLPTTVCPTKYSSVRLALKEHLLRRPQTTYDGQVRHYYATP